jgi:exonuclease SbcD
MRILHTSDWHVGKLLRGRSRLEEHRAVLGEIADVAAHERVDLALVVGDLFETAAPTPEAWAVVVDALLALRESGAHVVVVGGNHDQQALLDAVAPAFGTGITIVGLLDNLDRAVIRVDGATVVALPWVSQRWAVKADQLMQATAAETTQFYAARMTRVIEHLCASFATGTINVIAAHAMVQGGRLGGGERDAQLIDEYLVPAAAFPTSAAYVALGHLHRAQQIPGGAPIWYCGSPIQVDFGEERDIKQVLLVDVTDTGAARVTPVHLQSGWQLRTVSGTLDQLASHSHDDALLRVFVEEPARPGLADDVRALLPNAVDVRVVVPAEENTPDALAAARKASLSPRDLFGAYLDATGNARDERVVALFDELLDEVSS